MRSKDAAQVDGRLKGLSLLAGGSNDFRRLEQIAPGAD
jgi:hypothetical protein